MSYFSHIFVFQWGLCPNKKGSSCCPWRPVKYAPVWSSVEAHLNLLLPIQQMVQLRENFIVMRFSAPAHASATNATMFTGLSFKRTIWIAYHIMQGFEFKGSVWNHKRWVKTLQFLPASVLFLLLFHVNWEQWHPSVAWPNAAIQN